MVNAIYAQSGGMTAVINVSATAVIEECMAAKPINHIYAAQNGILGVLQENLIDISCETKKAIKLLPYTPGGIFGSCRYKLQDVSKDNKDYQRIIKIFKTHNIRYFFYNGGNDSADTCLKVAQVAKAMQYELCAVHIPKTIDNDLYGTHTSPGYGSAAKYITNSTKEATLDLMSMYLTSTKVFILEVMGRDVGWLAASSGVITNDNFTAPHIILFPEVNFVKELFLTKVQQTIKDYGYCVIVVSEGVILNKKNITTSGLEDAFGHIQLGGVASELANFINNQLKVKCHYAVVDYLQRSARHLASQCDVDLAYKVGSMAVKFALQGLTEIMVSIVQKNDGTLGIDHIDLHSVANKVKKLPSNFISDDSFHITQACKKYVSQLITGESYPYYQDGVLQHADFKKILLPKRLSPFNQS